MSSDFERIMRKHYACAVFSDVVEAVWRHPSPSREEDSLLYYIYIQLSPVLVLGIVYLRDMQLH